MIEDVKAAARGFLERNDSKVPASSEPMPMEMKGNERNCMEMGCGGLVLQGVSGRHGLGFGGRNFGIKNG